jgi:hypothetical protein
MESGPLFDDKKNHMYYYTSPSYKCAKNALHYVCTPSSFSKSNKYTHYEQSNHLKEQS